MKDCICASCGEPIASETNSHVCSECETETDIQPSDIELLRSLEKALNLPNALRTQAV